MISSTSTDLLLLLWKIHNKEYLKCNSLEKINQRITGMTSKEFSYRNKHIIFCFGYVFDAAKTC